MVEEVNLQTNLCGLTLNNPIITASGTCGYGAEMARFYDLNVLGGISLKGTTLHPREGNETPRIAECASGLLNSVGLQNVGIDRLINEKLPALRAIYNGIIFANISGFTINEYQQMAQLLDNSSADVIEVNISCPNVHGGGLAFGASPQDAYAVTRAVKSVTSKKVFVKLSPNVTDIAAIAVACEQGGADGLCMINTLLGLRIDLNTRRPLLANVTGGLSGPALLPVALQAVYKCYRAVGIPIIGIGGISSAQDVCEMLLCGASAVQIGSANLVNPYVCAEIVRQLPSQLASLKANNIKELIGGANN